MNLNELKIQVALVLLVISSIPSAFALESCPGYEIGRTEYSLSALNPPQAQYGYVTLPAPGAWLYRGALEANPQFSLISTLKGILGEKNWFLGSPMLYGIKQVLTGEWQLNGPFFPKGGLTLEMEAYFKARKIDEDIQKLLSCRTDKKYSESEASVLAADLMNKAFARADTAALERRFFNMADPEYYSKRRQEIGFGNNAADFVVASLYDQVSALYGKKLLVLKDTRNRSLDLGHYNKAKNGFFFHSWVDNGEINLPGYVTGEEIFGFQQRKVERTRTGWGTALPNNPIDYAVYKFKTSSGLHALVVDGKDNLCIVAANDQKLYRCRNYWDDNKLKDISYLPVARSTTATDRIPLIGVISACRGESCNEVRSIINSYGAYSSKSLPPEIIAQIESTTVNSKPLKFVAIDLNQIPFEGIRVTSATYAEPGQINRTTIGNVTKAAQTFANGKVKVTYTVRSKFLNVALDSNPKEFQIEWQCGHTPTETKKHSIPAPAEGKSLEINCEVSP